MAGSALVVGFGVFEDESVGSLQAVRTFLHAVRSVFKMNALRTVIRPLKRQNNREDVTINR